MDATKQKGLDDFLLLKNSLGGDNESAEILYRHWRPYVSYLMLKSNFPETIRVELINETFLRLFSTRAFQHNPLAGFKTYLTTIALNLIRKEKRSQRVRQKYQPTQIEDQDQVPSDPVEQKELKELILNKLEQLNGIDRRLLVAYFFEDRPIAQIAGQNGLSEACVYQRIHRIKKKFSKDKKLSKYLSMGI